MSRGQVRRRPDRESATVVVHGTVGYVEGVDPDVLQLVAMSAGIDLHWLEARWAFAAADALPVAAALRACGRAVRLSSGVTR